MAQAARKGDTPTATYADLLQLPEHLMGEILNGELHTMPLFQTYPNLPIAS